jgi:tetratricopeptide (TPR) repeat protein
MLRRRLGEPRKNLQEFNQPLEVATTSSVDALKAYARAEEYRSAGDEANAIEQYRRAIQIDPDFALAHRELAQSLWPSALRAQAINEVQKTYDLSTRLAKQDRLLAETRYFITATGDLEEAVSRLAEAVRIYPNWADPHHLHAHVLRLLGRFEDAVPELREAIRLDPDSYWIHANLMFCEMAMERYGEAKAAFEAARTLGLEQPARFLRYCLAFVQRDTGSMEEQLRWAADCPKSPLSAELLNGEASAARYFGRMKSARGLVGHAMAVAQNSGLAELAAKFASQEAVAESLVGNATFMREAAARAMALNSDVAIMLNAALALALSTDFMSAENLAAQVSAGMPQFTTVQNFDLPCIRAAIAIGQGKATDAIRLLDPARRYELAEGNVPRLCPSYLRGLAYFATGDGQKASGEFRRVIEHPGIVWIHSIGALAHLQLARAQVMMCNKAAARQSYEHFLTLWKDADPDIPVYEQSKAEYAKLT